ECLDHTSFVVGQLVPRHGHQNGFLVWKILVKCAHADPGVLSDVVRIERGASLALQNPSCSLEDYLHRILGPRLSGRSSYEINALPMVLHSLLPQPNPSI